MRSHRPETERPAQPARATRPEGGTKPGEAGRPRRTRNLKRISPKASRPRRMAGSSRTTCGATDCMGDFGKTMFRRLTNASPRDRTGPEAGNALTARDQDAPHGEARRMCERSGGSMSVEERLESRGATAHAVTGLMGRSLSFLRGRSRLSVFVSKGIPRKRGKGRTGSERSHCPETERPAPPARASRPEGGTVIPPLVLGIQKWKIWQLEDMGVSR